MRHQNDTFLAQPNLESILVESFDLNQFDLCAIANGEAWIVEFQIPIGEAWVDYSAEVFVKYGRSGFEFQGIDITNLIFHETEPSFASQELENWIMNANYNQ